MKLNELRRFTVTAYYGDYQIENQPRFGELMTYDEAVEYGKELMEKYIAECEVYVLIESDPDGVILPEAMYYLKTNLGVGFTTIADEIEKHLDQFC